ncbi:Biotin carboxylase of acetyl-CoA carboxylase [Enhygromyxa salina]|uniref:biotin carboxylase n=1 Tax=Enhygromyxa salina TaxID=215803 RepID=A0A0C1ZRP5_9BACT|nr:biotin carboxylase N-terminal domain-containing protein [Enhygromyxa salina]KIG13683.1 Biotin carboxylase of acetyl-CoA carboxylase [Enhygromyxa salina]
MAGFHRLFIANRGEVATRIARSCDELGITPVFGVSAADRGGPWTEGREQVVLGPARSTHSYLALERVVQAARQSGCTALHPGWGFLAENPRFAGLCEQHGVTFIGPPAHVMRLMGSKTPAKQAMGGSGLTLIPGSDGILSDLEHARRVAETVGYPVLLKAESGGGGKGMRAAQTANELEQAWTQASAEAQAAFGDARLYLEKLIQGGRHIEIQIMADRYGNVVHLGERDCTVQRSHQKLIEESPAPTLDPDERARTLAAAVEATRAIGYVGAGTIEFLLDQAVEGAHVLRFMEMNTRLQVEHCVSEMRSGVDLVREQIRVAAGHRLSVTQDQIALTGHAIECRINAEDPAQGFRPSPGVITKWVAPSGPGIRVDTHVRAGYEVPPFYDSLICKVITHGDTRDAACDQMILALEQLVCEGVQTTIPMHLQILRSPEFRSHRYDTRAIPGFAP